MNERPLPVEVAGLWALAFASAAVFGIHGVGYWDAGDYVRLAIEGGMSGLLLGRPLFLLASHLILSTGVDPASAEPVLRWFWSGVGSIAAPALMLLAMRLGISRRASLAAGIALALSPAFANASHQVLTDAPSLAFAILALLAAAQGRAVAAGLLIAIAILTRETAAVHLVAIVLLLKRRAPIAFAVAAVVMAVTLYAYPPPAFGAWVSAMSRTVQSRPVTLWQIVAPFVWILAAGPIPVIAGIVILVRRREFAPAGDWLVVSLPAAVATVLLLFYPDGWFSPRYMLATVPLAFFLPAAAWMADRRRLMAVALVVPLLIMFVATRSARAAVERGTGVTARIAQLPPNTLVVPGHYCPEAQLGATIHRRPDLMTLCPGWGWPKDPAGVLDAALAENKPVAVDIADDAWIPPGEAASRDAIRAWAARHQGRDVAGFLVIQK